jgi:hypothetical protein
METEGNNAPHGIGENRMSSLFEAVTPEEWVEAGAGRQAEKGLYLQLLEAVAEGGQRYNRIPTAPDSGGRFAGAKASSITTALKTARGSDKAPASVKQIQVSSKGGVIFLENEAVEA